MPLFGSEVEYALAVDMAESGESVIQARRNLATKTIFRALSRYPHLPTARSMPGMFFPFGGEIYIDRNRIEAALPEVTDPRSAVICEKGVERFIALAMDSARAELPGIRFHLIKNNRDYSYDEHTQGCHLSVLMRRRVGFEQIRRQLVPFLVTRVYAGSGTLSNDPASGGMALFQRADHITRESGLPYERSIVSQRDECLSGKEYRRLHLEADDSLMSELGIYLAKATVLIVFLIDMGFEMADDIVPADSVHAFRAISSDPGARVLLRDGRLLTACQIQRRYFRKLEKHIRYLPRWAHNFLDRLDIVLTLLESGDPTGQLSTMLDYQIKMRVFTEWLREQGRTWREINLWWSAVRGGRIPFDQMLEASNYLLRCAFPETFTAHCRAFGESPDIRGILIAILQLIRLDASYHTIDESGLFNRLDRAGFLRHRIAREDEILAAMHEPPSGARSEIRGRMVAALYAKKQAATASWISIVPSNGDTFLDLSDPFERWAVWKPKERKPETRTARGGLPPFLQRMMEM
jgi:hypothetical protein